MAWRGAHQFPCILTSDGSMDTYPDNKSSKFRIFLREPIDLRDEEWEVCLLSINYPYSWTNLGPSAKVFMRYYVDRSEGVREVHFPDWQCSTMEEVVKFMSKQMWQKEESRSVWFGLDELGRFKMESTTEYLDIGFSDNMLRLLGMGGHKLAPQLRLESFEKRQRARDVLDSIWREDNTVNYGDADLRRQVLQCKDAMDFSRTVARYLEPTGVKMKELYDTREDVRKLEVEELKNVSAHEHQEKQGELAVIFLKVMNFLLENMKSLCREPLIPLALRGVTPGVINPIQRMFIYTNIIEPMDFNNKFVKLLKMVNTRGSPFKTTQEDFSQPLYHAVQKGKISVIEILIADEDGDPVSFQSGTAVLTLHFRKSQHRGVRY